MAYTFRLDEQDERNLEKIMKAEGIKTKSKAIKLALRIAANLLKRGEVK